MLDNMKKKKKKKDIHFKYYVMHESNTYGSDMTNKR